MKPAARKKLKKKIQHRVLDVFTKERKKSLNYKQVASRLNERDADVRLMISESLKELTSSGKLQQVESGRYKLVVVKAIQNGIEGTIDISRRGKIFFCSDALPEDVVVAQKRSIHVLKGDKVLAKISKKGKDEIAQVYELVHREERFYSGILDIDTNFAFVMADDPFMPADIFISTDKLKGAKDGQKVAVKLTGWPESAASPFGEIIEIIGEPGVPDTEMVSILYEFGLPTEFPQGVLDESERISLKISRDDLKGRLDIRDVCTFTIDPHDAKDFDDAISIVPLDSGKGHRIGVHIADVAHYVKPNSQLDQEASKRATSVYLADRVVPMLPEILSNVLCSLRPNEDKLAFSVLFDMDDTAEVSNVQITRTAIHSDHRFTYKTAQEGIETGTGPYAKELKTLDTLAKVMRKRRMKQGSFDFHSEEVRFRYDDKGHPVEVMVKTMGDSNKLVEEFMLLANQSVARYVKTIEPKPAFIYRNHDLPDVEKLVNLRTFAHGLGLHFDPANNNPREAIKKLMHDAQGLAEEPLLQQMVIRTMAKADYGAVNIGHYGLGFEDYSHFTSPIRRYPDVIAHRLLALYLAGRRGMSESEVQVKARHSSLRERKAVEAERASNKYMQALYLKDKVGKTFEGKISGVASFGIFVMLLENHCEGMISLRNMEDDHYVFRKEDNVVEGQRHGREFHLGDIIQVKVISADALSRQIDFALIGDDNAGRSSNSSGRGRSGGHGHSGGGKHKVKSKKKTYKKRK